MSLALNGMQNCSAKVEEEEEEKKMLWDWILCEACSRESHEDHKRGPRVHCFSLHSIHTLYYLVLLFLYITVILSYPSCTKDPVLIFLI